MITNKVKIYILDVTDMDNIKYTNHKYLPDNHTIESIVVVKDYIVTIGNMVLEEK